MGSARDGIRMRWDPHAMGSAYVRTRWQVRLRGQLFVAGHLILALQLASYAQCVRTPPGQAPGSWHAEVRQRRPPCFQSVGAHVILLPASSSFAKVALRGVAFASVAFARAALVAAAALLYEGRHTALSFTPLPTDVRRRRAESPSSSTQSLARASCPGMHVAQACM